MNNNVEQQIQQFIERQRPEKDIRKNLNFGYSYKNNVVELLRSGVNGTIKLILSTIL